MCVIFFVLFYLFLDTLKMFWLFPRQIYGENPTHNKQAGKRGMCEAY